MRFAVAMAAAGFALTGVGCGEVTLETPAALDAAADVALDVGEDALPLDVAAEDTSAGDAAPVPDAATSVGDAGEQDAGGPVVLKPCLQHTDCDSGVCLALEGAEGCAPSCTEDCAGGWVCKSLPGASDAPTDVCVPPAQIACMPCTTDVDCNGVDPDGGHRCLPYGEAGSFCAVACVQGGCAQGFTCEKVGALSVCRRDEAAGPCGCSDLATFFAASTACLLSDGCGGQRSCGQAGLSGCKQVADAAEICDGVDNDCDGDTDEGSCDDGNPCTADTCDPKAAADQRCQHGSGDGSCEDGNPCTSGDTCKGGFCTPGGPNSCDDKDDCTIDSCDPWAGGCQHVGTQGGPCDDGVPCTLAGVCELGSCKKGKTNTCDDNNACTQDLCDPKTDTCAHKALPDGAFCDDTDACTLSESCKAGWCQGLAKTCEDNNACTKDGCDKGVCFHEPLTLACDDGSACTQQDTCAGGKCKGTEASCDDGNPCTVDGCDKASGCIHPPASGPCDDGNPCTTGESCKYGKCEGGTNKCDCQNDGDCQKLEDGNPCNGTLVCDTTSAIKVCVVDPKTVVVCKVAGNAPCKVSSCQPKTGKCEESGVPDGMACEGDGKPCTVETCKGGQCGGSAPKDCDDLNPCTVDACAAASGACTHDQGPLAGKACAGDQCLIGGLCKLGKCVGGKPKVCEDTKPCADVACAPKTGACEANGAPWEGKGCDADGDACTGPDLCKSGVCVAGAKTPCDDGNPCTADACNPKLGCTHTPVEVGTGCGGANVCVSGQCKPACLAWEAQFLSPDKDHGWFFSVAALAQGRVAAVGRARVAGKYRGWAVVADAEGKQIANVALDPDGYRSYLYGAVTGPSDTVYAAGENRQTPFSSTRTGYVVRFDANGQKLWVKTVQLGVHSVFYGVSATADGGVAAVGQVYTGSDYDGFVARLGSNGAEVYKQGVTGGGVKAQDYLNGVSAMAGDLYAVGHSPQGTQSNQGWLLKVTESGKQVWSKYFGGAGSDQLRKVRAVAGGVLVAGSTYVSPKGYEGWLMRLDPDGNVTWQKTLGGTSTDRFEDLALAADGTMVTVGQSNLSGKGYDGWAVLWDKDGKQLAEKTYGGSNTETLTGAEVTSDGRFALAGYAPHATGKTAGWLLRVGKNLVPGCK